ncbi:hypothetical protein CEP54_010628 [Fusarium duplospermum]|uniref:Uncharacterized protein n=1 Tax=Fusarium duplospermum TaxID=1325734 RepID=A0A428PJ22_9HYPO|nr:hypothetical protein CEP54_010628 [Fusarium duplospermum]
MKTLQEAQNMRQDLQERVNAVIKSDVSRKRQVISSHAGTTYDYATLVINMDRDTAV